jgi:hypothetical protein
MMGSKPTTDEGQITNLLWLIDEQGRPTTPPPLVGMTDPLSSCKASAEGNGAMLVESPPPTTFSTAEYKWWWVQPVRATPASNIAAGV